MRHWPASASQDYRQRPLSPTSGIGSLRRHVKDKLVFNRLLDRFAKSEPLTIHAGNSRVRAFRLQRVLDHRASEIYRRSLRLGGSRLCLQEPGHSPRLLPHFGPLAAGGPRGGSQLGLFPVLQFFSK